MIGRTRGDRRDPRDREHGGDREARDRADRVIARTARRRASSQDHVRGSWAPAAAAQCVIEQLEDRVARRLAVHPDDVPPGACEGVESVDVPAELTSVGSGAVRRRTRAPGGTHGRRGRLSSRRRSGARSVRSISGSGYPALTTSESHPGLARRCAPRPHLGPREGDPARTAAGTVRPDRRVDLGFIGAAASASPRRSGPPAGDQANSTEMQTRSWHQDSLGAEHRQRIDEADVAPPRDAMAQHATARAVRGRRARHAAWGRPRALSEAGFPTGVPP